MPWHCDVPLRFAPEPQTNPVLVVAPNWSLDLDDNKDYIVDLGPSPRPHTLAVNGGRHVRIIGGEIHISNPGAPAVKPRGQTGSMYVEGLKITGPNTGDGFLLDQRKSARVTIQNVYVEGVYGAQDGIHADLIQTWAGPRRLEIDRFHGKSNYQGVFLHPNQFGTQPPPELVDMSRVQVDVSDGAYALWRDDAEWSIYATEVWVNSDKPSRDMFLWPKPSTGNHAWDAVQQGTPPASFVDPERIGIGYQSMWAT